MMAVRRRRLRHTAQSPRARKSMSHLKPIVITCVLNCGARPTRAGQGRKSGGRRPCENCSSCSQQSHWCSPPAPPSATVRRLRYRWAWARERMGWCWWISSRGEATVIAGTPPAGAGRAGTGAVSDCAAALAGAVRPVGMVGADPFTGRLFAQRGRGRQAFARRRQGGQATAQGGQATARPGQAEAEAGREGNGPASTGPRGSG